MSPQRNFNQFLDNDIVLMKKNLDEPGLTFADRSDVFVKVAINNAKISSGQNCNRQRHQATSRSIILLKLTNLPPRDKIITKYQNNKVNRNSRRYLKDLYETLTLGSVLVGKTHQRRQ